MKTLKIIKKDLNKIVGLLQRFSTEVDNLYGDNKTVGDERTLEKKYARKIISNLSRPSDKLKIKKTNEKHNRSRQHTPTSSKNS